MQIVIDISENDYYDALQYVELKANTGLENLIICAIKNCTPLPKGHGRLIDADAFLKDNDDYTGWILYSKAWGGENGYRDALEDLVAEAQTIIEADTESEVQGNG